MRLLSNLAYRIACVLLAAALGALQAVPAFAAIQGSDYVGSTTVTDRSLTITEAPVIDAAYGILCDADGTVLWSRGADEPSAMASITKVMTAVVALENASLDDEFTVSAAAASVGESSAGLAAGNKVNLKSLLCGLLIHSGNDAAYAIAEGVGGSVDAFVEMMNAKAAELGLTNTHYANPHGLDAQGHYSSASDICVLSRYAMNNETFREIVGMRKVTLDYGGGKQTFKSTNSLLNTWDECTGIKTGYTNDAGYCLTSSAERDGIELYAVVLGCSNEAERFTDCYKLLDWGFSHYRPYTLATTGDVLVDVPLTGFLNKTVPAGVPEDVTSMVLDYDGDISIDVTLVDLPDGVDEGERVGTVTWRQNENVLASAPLVAKEHVGAPWAVQTLWTSIIRLVGWFTGDEGVAAGTLHAQTIAVTRNDDLSGEEIDSELESSIRSDALSAQ